MIKKSWMVMATIATATFSGTALADSISQRLVCTSQNYGYQECQTGHMAQPTLVEQLSHSDCIEGRSWGYYPKQQALWVDHGCSAVFVDAGGRHNRYDSNTQNHRHERYDPPPPPTPSGQQPHFEGPRHYDAPPEPGQSELHGPSNYDAPPEPGQSELHGPSD